MTNYVALRTGVLVARTNGGVASLYRGGPVPADATSASVTHLLELGYIEEGGPFGGPDDPTSPAPEGPRPSAAIPLPSPGDAGKVLTVADSGDAYELAAGGALQIAAKPTTPQEAATNPITGGPALYASTSAALEDGGWMGVDIQQHTVELFMSATDGTEVQIDSTINDDFGAAADAQSTLYASRGGKSAGVTLHASADSTLGTSTVRADDGVSGAQAGCYYDNFSGAYIQVVAADGQTGPLLVLYSGGVPIFQVDAAGPQIPSPNGSMHRIVVANDGTLSTQAV
jgi:hypothetical protein